MATELGRLKFDEKDGGLCDYHLEKLLFEEVILAAVWDSHVNMEFTAPHTFLCTT